MFAGLDATLHMAEECLEPAIVVPKSILATIGIGFGTAFSFSVAMAYCITDLDTVLNTPTR